MMRTHAWVWVCLVCLFFVAGVQAQGPVSAEPQCPTAPSAAAPAAATPEARVLRLVKFTGELRDAMGRPRTGVFGLTFALYEQQEGGAARWLETQNVELDAQGRYSVLLGATRSEGLPLELFTSGQARWLGIQVEGDPAERERVLLVSVPYALKAADADTLGGRPLSAFVLAEAEAQAGSAGTTGSGQSPSAIESGRRIVSQIAAVSGTGTINKLTKWTDTLGALGDSAVFESGGFVGIGTTSPQSQLHLFDGGISTYLTLTAPLAQQSAIAFDDATNGHDAILYRFQGSRDLSLWTPTVGDFLRFTQSGNVGIGTSNPQSQLHLFNGGISAYFRITAPLAQQSAISFEDTTNGQDLILYRFQGTRDLSLWTPTAGDFLRFTQSGNVGIGTTSPTEKLDVAGNLKVSGSILNSSGVIAGGTGSFSATSSGPIVSAAQAGAGPAGTFSNTAGGLILSGLSGTSGTQVFSVDGSGKLAASSGSFTGSTSSWDSSIVTVTQQGSITTTPPGFLSTQPPIALLGEASTTTNLAIGVVGMARSPDALGVAGLNYATTGAARGVVGATRGTSGRGVLGIAEATTGPTFGVSGIVQSTSGTGVSGYAQAFSGSTVGVYGRVESSSGTAGVFNNLAGGPILSGQNNDVEKFRVDGSGNVRANAYLDLAGNPIVGGLSDVTGTAPIVVTSPTTTTRNVALDSSGIFTGASGNFSGSAATALVGTTSNATNGSIGVQGSATASTGATFGVSGLTFSTTDGAGGVLGVARGATGRTHGVRGATDSTSDLATGVWGEAEAATGRTFGVWGNSNGTDGIGVHATAFAATGQTYGVWGVSSSTNGTGVHGGATATTGATFGVSGTSSSGTGTGVFGMNTATTGNAEGVYGTSSSGTGTGVYGRGTYGVRGVSSSSSTGAGVWGQAVGSGGVGVEGNSSGAGGYGVVGQNTATTGEAVGVYGTSSSSDAIGVLGSGYRGVKGISTHPDGMGVFGTNTATFGAAYGVYGTSDSSTGFGVYGNGFYGVYGSGNYGVYGVTSGAYGVAGISNSSLAYGVYGQNSAGGKAGYFSGDVHVAGTLTKTTGTFKIDHPLEPATKYLSHSFVESPDMLNIYNGVVMLDRRGEVWVSLPEWFEALNSDFRYQLTAMGGPQPRLYIAREVSGNRFKIAGGRPGLKVSWQVTGIRQDAYARAHRIQVEEEKPAAERGFYLHPEVFGQPKEKGIEYARHPEPMREREKNRTQPATADAGSR